METSTNSSSDFLKSINSITEESIKTKDFRYISNQLFIISQRICNLYIEMEKQKKEMEKQQAKILVDNNITEEEMNTILSLLKDLSAKSISKKTTILTDGKE